MKPEFTRMQGLGNKFVVFLGPLEPTTQEVIDYCKAYSPEGADGMLVVSPIDRRSVQMHYWNADGSEAEMCGNGLRCVARFAVDNDLVDSGEFTVNTAVGPLQVIWDGTDSNNIEVQVGKAVVTQTPVMLEDTTFYDVSVGNPHAVTFVSSVANAPVLTLGPIIENDEHFPNKTNVEFVEIVDKNRIKVRTWERGVGETLACGTGMVAAASTAVQVKGAAFPLTVEVLGGEAKVWLDEAGYTRMVGPAEVVETLDPVA